eukprot:10631960-Heterocapsa_arctica.AAC.1
MTFARAPVLFGPGRCSGASLQATPAEVLAIGGQAHALCSKDFAAPLGWQVRHAPSLSDPE